MSAAEATVAAVSSKSGLRNRTEAENKLKGILLKYKKIGLRDNDFAKMLKPHYKSNRGLNLKFKTSILFMIIFASTGMFYLFFDYNDDNCWISMPNVVTKATRPPEVCAMCVNTSAVLRLTDLTPEDFEKHYAYNGIPIVVTDATHLWSALKVFDFLFFKKVYTESNLENAARDCQFFPYKTEFASLYDALQMNLERANLTQGSKSWYIGWSNCHDSVARLLRVHYSRPYFLPQSAENAAVDWIFMGGPGDGAQMHVDNVVHPSWQAQLKGKKRWHLAPPPECHYACKPMQVVIQPGEIIVLDTNRWYHKTEILPGEISITIGAEYD